MLVEAEIWTVARTDKGTAVLVRPIGSDRAVPIFIGQLEAHSILIGMGEVPMPRPLTHDLILQLAEKLHVQIERVEITDLQEGTYYARILLKQGMKKIVLDARPSDALGLATRVKCPVFIAEYIVDESSIPVNMITEDNGEVSDVPEMENPEGDEEEGDESPVEGPREDLLETPLDVQKAVLKMQLEKAIQEENYEEAARLRDILGRLQS
jgi:bifunctional DNase/RNase